jgi:hypothetical protein
MKHKTSKSITSKKTKMVVPKGTVNEPNSYLSPLSNTNYLTKMGFDNV